MSYCSTTLSGIKSDCLNSIGGVKRVFITPYQDGLFTASATTDGTMDVITALTSGENITYYEYNFKKGTSQFTSTLNKDVANGISYVSTELVLQFNRQDAKKRLEINALALGDVFVIVEDANGQFTALGTNEPAEATAGSGQSGQARTDGNFYQITLTDDCPTFPPFLSAEAVAELLKMVKTTV